MTQETINLHTIGLELKAAVKKLKKKYPAANHVSGNLKIQQKWGNNVEVFVHHDCLEHSCEYGNGETVGKAVAMLHRKLREFASQLQ